MELRDKVIVVTGGGRGIGRGLCERFARESPAALWVVDLDAQAAEVVAAETGGTARQCDVAAESDIKRVIAEVESKCGRVDLFCANAGIGTAGGVDAPDADWQRVMDVNLMSHVYSSRAVLPGMIARQSGYLLHTASAAGLLTQLGSAPYAVSKHAAVALAEWLAITYGDQGIRVSCLCPQGVMTDMLESDDPAVQSLRRTALTVEQVSDSVVAGIRDEHFLILPHAEVARYFRNKAENYDRWIGGMKKIQRGFSDMVS